MRKFKTQVSKKLINASQGLDYGLEQSNLKKEPVIASLRDGKGGGAKQSPDKRNSASNKGIASPLPYCLP